MISLPFCWYHGLLSVLRFHSIIKWLPVVHIWHEMCNHKSFYLSQAACSKIILLLKTTEERKKKKKTVRFSQTELCSQDQAELSVVLLCIIILGLLLNTVYLYDSELAGKCRNVFHFGILSFHWSIDFTETTVHMSLDNPPFKVKKHIYYCCNHKDIAPIPSSTTACCYTHIFIKGLQSLQINDCVVHI